MKEDFKEDTGMELFITLCLPREIRIGSIPIAIGVFLDKTGRV